MIITVIKKTELILARIGLAATYDTWTRSIGCYQNLGRHWLFAPLAADAP